MRCLMCWVGGWGLWLLLLPLVLAGISFFPGALYGMLHWRSSGKPSNTANGFILFWWNFSGCEFLNSSWYVWRLRLRCFCNFNFWFSLTRTNFSGTSVRVSAVDFVWQTWQCTFSFIWRYVLVLKMSVSSLVISDEVCLRKHLAPARVVFFLVPFSVAKFNLQIPNVCAFHQQKTLSKYQRGWK